MMKNLAHRTGSFALIASLLAFAVLLGGAATGGAATASATGTGFLSFYESNNATQALLCSIPVPPGSVFTQVNFTADPYGCENDEARSMVFDNVGPGITVEVWNDSNCSNARSDRSIIDIGVFGRDTVGTFESTTPQERGRPFYQTYIRKTGDLDGKVSCVKIIRR